MDTGAWCNVLSSALLKHIDPSAQIDHRNTVNLVAYEGRVIKTVGTTDVDFTSGKLQFHIVDSNVKPLLGLIGCVKLGFVHLGPGVHTLQQEAPERTEYNNLFDTSTILPVVYHMHLDSSVHPVICAPRRVPLAMK